MESTKEKVWLCLMFIDFGRDDDFIKRYNDIEDFCEMIMDESETYPVPCGFHLGGEKRFTVIKEGYSKEMDVYTYQERDYIVGTVGFVAKQQETCERLCIKFKSCYNYKHTNLIFDIEVDDLCTFD